MGLKEYQQKRQFNVTPEPKGKVSRASKLRFVVQKHEASRLHYDFRIELDGVLKSWAVPKGPSMNPLDQRLAIQVEDHPIEYGAFEGVIPKGNYGGGTVMLWDRGTYQERTATNPKDAEKFLREGLSKGKITIVLKGKKLNGEFALIRLKRRNQGPHAWLMIKKRDSHAVFRPSVDANARSVKSRRTMEEITSRTKSVWMPKRGKQPTLKPLSKLKTLSDREKPLLTHLSKIFWPKEGYTKGDLINYYDSIADYIVPHLKDRPESLRRQPDGLRNPGFFQKDMSGFVPKRVKTIRIHSSSANRTINYVLCQDKWALLYLANLGCIELNPWLSRIQHLEKPDFVVIDLDPDNNPFSTVVKVAKEVHKLLTSIGVKAWCKTSGATGLHICIPTAAKYNYEVSKVFAETICGVIHQKLPKITSVERNPARRKGKIYLDFLQNRRGQTLAAPYCVRPFPGAPVSTPLKWSELKPSLKPSAFTMFNIKKRLAKVGDLWPRPTAAGANLPAAQKKLLKILHNSKNQSI